MLKSFTKRQKKSNNKGFSLVELIVVIAIMAVLVGVLAPTLIRNVDKSRVSKDISALDSIKGAVETMLADETYYDALTNQTDHKFTVNGTTAAPTFSGDSAAALKTEFENLIGTNKSLLSSNATKEHKTITVNVTSTGQVSVVIYEKDTDPLTSGTSKFEVK